jgi:hypothetical protein
MLLAIEKKKRTYKVIGGFQISDNMLGILLFVFIMAVAYFNWNTVLNFGRWGSEWFELENMKTAATTYTGLRYDGAAPTSADDLINGITSAESIDGSAHPGLMSPKSGRWKNGTYNDAWGKPFAFSTDTDGSRTITSGGMDMQIGTADDITVYY